MKKSCLGMLFNSVLVALAGGLIGTTIGWFMGWRTSRQFSDGLFWIGGIVMVLGLMSLIGGQGVRANIGMLYSESAAESLADRTRKWVVGLSEDYSAVIYLFLGGAILVGASVLVDVLGTGPP